LRGEARVETRDHGRQAVSIPNRSEVESVCRVHRWYGGGEGLETMAGRGQEMLPGILSPVVVMMMVMVSVYREGRAFGWGGESELGAGWG
jgi:hypothetical protein